MTGSFSQAEEEILLARTIRRPLGRAARERFAGASVAVTGAGGSIGAELARQLASCRPARLTLVDQSEHGLFQIERELADRTPHVALDPVLADVTRASTMRRILRLRRPQVVFHAAAYKHVTMAERAACAAAAVNVLGTAVVLEAARHGPSGANAQPWHYIVVTDSAVKKQIADYFVDEQRKRAKMKMKFPTPNYRGLETAPGVKDVDKIAAFCKAVSQC